MKRLTFAAALGAAIVAGCGAASQPGEAPAGAPKGLPPPEERYPFEPTQGPDVTADTVRLGATQDGQRLFNRRCGVCHLQGGMGTALLALRLGPDKGLLQSRDDLTADYVVQVARQGIGNMPRLSRVEVTDAELKAIAAHLAKGK